MAENCGKAEATQGQKGKGCAWEWRSKVLPKEQTDTKSKCIKLRHRGKGRMEILKYFLPQHKIGHRLSTELML